jgi:hypothetical protein
MKYFQNYYGEHQNVCTIRPVSPRIAGVESPYRSRNANYLMTPLVTPLASGIMPSDTGSRGVYVSGDKSLTADADKEWKLAQARVLLYLQALDIPAIRALELALGALQRASSQEAAQASEIHPTMAAMRALRGLLRENEASSSKAGDEKRRIWRGIAPSKEHSALTNTENGEKLSGNNNNVLGCRIANAPSINRQSMIPGEFDRKPWRYWFVKIFMPWKKAPFRSMPYKALR